MTDSGRLPQYDAFISYSRKDVTFAALLEEALEAYKPARSLNVPQRHLEICRDQRDLIGVEYSRALDRHLEASAVLIVVCSPDARASTYVDDEIQRFVAKKGSERVIPVLVAGTPNNEGTPTTSDLAFPAALCDALPTPLAADYRGFNPGIHKIDRGPFEGAWYTILANIYDLPRHEIEEREVARRRRDRRRTIAIVSVISAILAVAGSVAFWQRNTAKTQQQIAGERRTVASVRQLALAANTVGDTQNDLALLLGVEARRRGDILESRQSLLTALVTKPQFEGFLWGNRNYAVTALQFSADSGVLAVGYCMRDTTNCKEREVRLFDTVSRSLVRSIDQRAGPEITALAFSVDGTVLATADHDGALNLVDAKTGAVRHTSMADEFEIPSFWGISGAAFSPDGKQLAVGACGTAGTASGCDDSQVIVIDTTTMQVSRRTPKLRGAQVFSLTFTGPGELRWLLGMCAKYLDSRTSCTDLRVRTWTISQSTVGSAASVSLPDSAGNMLTPGGPTAVALASDGDVVASAYCAKPEVFKCVQAGIRFSGVTAETKPTSLLLAGHLSAVNSLAFGGQRFLASGGEDGSVMLWSRTASATFGEAVPTDAERLYSAAFSPDGAALAAGGCDRYADEGLDRGCREPSVYLITLGTNREVKRLETQTLAGSVRAVAFSPDGSLLAAGTDANQLMIWKTRERTVLARASAEPNQSVLAVRFSPDGGTLFAGGKGGITVWDLPSRTSKSHLKQVSGSVLAVAVSPDGRRFASGGEDRAVSLWDMADLTKPTLLLTGPTGAVTALQFYNRMSRLVASAEDGIAVWDLQSNKRLGLPFQGHTGPVISVEVSPDGHSAISAGLDRQVLLWDLETGQPLGPPLSHGQAWRGVAFHPFGKVGVAVGHGPDVSVWPATAEAWADLACRRANRNLTKDEWTTYFGDEPPRKTCPELP